MSYLVDTNVLLRSAQPSHPMHAEATRAVAELLSRGATLSIIPQNIIEYWAVATRPVEANGFGMNVKEVAAGVAGLTGIFRLLPDTEAIFTEWQGLVNRYAVKGKQVHDARIVAAMLAHRVTHLLTFNTDDFKRYVEIISVNPHDV